MPTISSGTAIVSIIAVVITLGVNLQPHEVFVASTEAQRLQWMTWINISLTTALVGLTRDLAVWWQGR